VEKGGKMYPPGGELNSLLFIKLGTLFGKTIGGRLFADSCVLLC